jgi:hypothetical protein
MASNSNLSGLIEYHVNSRTLADWIERTPDWWWYVDGDPWLADRLDLPCPPEELAEALREADRGIVVVSSKTGPDPLSPLQAGDLDRLVDFDHLQQRELACRWETDSEDMVWALHEDHMATRLFGEEQE